MKFSPPAAIRWAQSITSSPPVVPEVLRSKVSVFVDLFKKSEQVKRKPIPFAAAPRSCKSSPPLPSPSTAPLPRQNAADRHRYGARSHRCHQAITLFIDPRPGHRPEKVQAFASFSDKYSTWRGQPLQLDSIADTAVFRSYTATRLTEKELLDHADWDIVRKVRIPPICGGMLAAPSPAAMARASASSTSATATMASFTADDESIAVQLAQMASIAVENSPLRRRTRSQPHQGRIPLHPLARTAHAAQRHHRLDTVLQMEKPQGEMAHGLEVIERNARAQTKLIEDLLDVSRISSGKLKLNLEIVTLASIIDAAVECRQTRRRRREVQLEVEAAPRSPSASSPTRTACSRSSGTFSPTPSNSPPPRAVSIDSTQEGARYQIRVTDTGLGSLPILSPTSSIASARPTALPPARTAAWASASPSSAISSNSTAAPSRADSRGEGLGSVFTVTLPIATSIVIPDRPARDSHAGRNGHPRPDLKGMRILVVDDAPDALEIVATILRRERADVTTASSAAEARRLLPEFKPDLLISDIAMPDEDGLSFIQSVRAMSPESGGTTPAIALTAYAREEDRPQASPPASRPISPSPSNTTNSSPSPPNSPCQPPSPLQS